MGFKRGEDVLRCYLYKKLIYLKFKLLIKIIIKPATYSFLVNLWIISLNLLRNYLRLKP